MLLLVAQYLNVESNVEMEGPYFLLLFIVSN